MYKNLKKRNQRVINVLEKIEKSEGNLYNHYKIANDEKNKAYYENKYCDTLMAIDLLEDDNFLKETERIYNK